MAGLVAAAEARRLGRASRSWSRSSTAPADRCGSRAASSGGTRTSTRFRAECPGGDETLQRLLFERLDEDLRWLEALGAPARARRDGQPAHHRRPLRPGGAHRALGGAAGGCRLGTRLRRAAARRAARARHGRLRRRRGSAAPARDPGGRSTRACAPRRAAPATGCGSAWPRGHARAPASARCTPAPMPAPPARVPAQDFVRLSQLYARHAEVTQRARREPSGPRTWSEIDVAQWAAPPAARARAGSACPCMPLGERVRRAQRGGDGRRGGGGRRARPARRRACDRGDGGRRDHHPRRAAYRRARVAPRLRCSPAAPTRAASPPAATRAGWRRRSCSAAIAARAALGVTP